MAYPDRVLNLGTWGVPVGIGSSGSVGANGALTLTTGMAITYGPIWLYFPAGAVFANSPAGVYYVVMTSTTAGTIYNIRLGTDLPYVPSAELLTQRGVVSASIGAYTQTTSAVDMVSVVVPGQTMGANGQLWAFGEGQHPNTANQKIYTWVFGGTAVSGVGVTTTTGTKWTRGFVNRGSVSTQYLTNMLSGQSSTSAANDQININTDQNQTLVTRVKLAVATDYQVIETQSVVVYYGL